MNLGPLMKPASIAVVGASQRMTRATRVVANLQRFGYAGRIFPINPKYTDVLGLPCYPDLASTRPTSRTRPTWAVFASAAATPRRCALPSATCSTRSGVARRRRASTARWSSA
jgi:hypothetical protein